MAIKRRISLLTEQSVRQATAARVMESRRERLQQCTIPASVHASAVAQVGAGLILRALLWLAPGLSMLACVDLSFV